MSTESAAPPAPLASTAPSAAPSFNALDTARMLLLLLLPRAAAASNACKRLDIWASCEWRRLALGGSSARSPGRHPHRAAATRQPPLRGDRTRGGTAERQGSPAAARVDRVLQLVDPSAQRQLLLLLQDAQVVRVRRSLRCRLTSKFKGEPGESLLVRLPRLGQMCGCRRRRCCWPPRAAAATAAA